MTTPASMAAKKVAQKATTAKAATNVRSTESKTKKSMPPSQEALAEKAKQHKKQQRRNTLEGLALTSAKRFSERHYRRMLIGEFILSLGIVITDELMDDAFVDAPNLKPIVAVCVVYLMLAFGTTFGTGPSRLSAAFGGLITLTILMKFINDTTYVSQETQQTANKLVDFFKGNTPSSATSRS